MDRYHKVEKPKPELPVNENEIRITSQGLLRNYISYATNLLQEKRVEEIILKAMGQAISKTVAISEIIKRRIPRLHQDNAISSISITDTFEPIEEGLETLEQTRHVSMISITLSTKELNKNSPGYQAPSNVDQTKQQYNYQPQQHPPGQVHKVYNAGNGDNYGRGRRGRGRGRGRGWNRGGYADNRGGYADNRGRYEDNRGGYEDKRGGYSNNRGGYQNNRGGHGDNRHVYEDNKRGYADNRGRGYADNRGGYADNMGLGYGNYQENGGYNYWGRGGRHGGYGYRGAGYGRGRGGGGRGYGGGRGRGGRMGGRTGGDGSNQTAAA